MAQNNSNLSKRFYSVTPIQDLEKINASDLILNSENQEQEEQKVDLIPIGLYNRKVSNAISIKELQKAIDTVGYIPSEAKSGLTLNQTTGGLMSQEDKWNLDDLVKNKDKLGLQHLKDGKTNGSIRNIFAIEENDNYSLGTGAFAEGGYSSAAGDYSHASGFHTIANNNYETVIGLFNDVTDGQSNELINLTSAVIHPTFQRRVSYTLPNFPTSGTNILINLEIVTNSSSIINPGTVEDTVSIECERGVVKIIHYQDNSSDFTITYDGNKLLTFETNGSGLNSPIIRFNSIEYSSSKQNLFVIGNGTNEENRSNAFIVNKKGDVIVSNNLTVLGNPTDNNHVVTKQYVNTSISNAINNIEIGLQNLIDGESTGSVQGINASATGQYSFAEGEGTIASGLASHAEGGRSYATNTNSHAEGSSCEASGYASHAEGDSCDAIGNYSHAEGLMTEARGESSHTSGKGTVAINNNEFVIGSYNLKNDSDNNIFVIGNGTDDSHRSNLFTIEKDTGNIWTPGNITSNNIIASSATINNLNIGQGVNIIDKLFPVGSIYSCTPDKNPNTFLHGTWELANKYLRQTQYNINRSDGKTTADGTQIIQWGNDVNSSKTLSFIANSHNNLLQITSKCVLKNAYQDTSAMDNMILWTLYGNQIGLKPSIQQIHSTYCTGVSDGMNAIVYARLDWENDNNILKAKLKIQDMITRSATIPTDPKEIGFSIYCLLSNENIENSFCNKIDWIRSA